MASKTLSQWLTAAEQYVKEALKGVDNLTVKKGWILQDRFPARPGVMLDIDEDDHDVDASGQAFGESAIITVYVGCESKASLIEAKLECSTFLHKIETYFGNSGIHSKDNKTYPIGSIGSDGFVLAKQFECQYIKDT